MKKVNKAKKIGGAVIALLVLVVGLFIGGNELKDSTGQKDNTAKPSSTTQPKPTNSNPGSEAAVALERIDSLRKAGQIKDKRCARTDRKGPTRDSKCTVAKYDREKQFGKNWRGKTCWDTRDKVLEEQLKNTKKDKCHIVAGQLDPDPYTGKTINFKRGPKTSLAVQVDHVFALALAWDLGAAKWDQKTRENFANDLGANLVASDGPTNVEKKDKGFNEWMTGKNNHKFPTKTMECTQAATFVNLVWQYNEAGHKLFMLTEDANYITKLMDSGKCSDIQGKPSAKTPNPV